MNLLKPYQLCNMVAIATTAIAFSGLGLSKAEAASLSGFFPSPNLPISVTGNFNLIAHPPSAATSSQVVIDPTPLALSASLGDNEIHGTTGSGSITGDWIVDPATQVQGLSWTITANVFPGQAPDLPVSFITTATFNNGVTSSTQSVVEPGLETIPEPTSTLSFLALGTLGAASTLKRKLKTSKSTEKEATKVS